MQVDRQVHSSAVSPEPSAKAIAEQLLDVTGAALLSGNFQAFRPHFILPNTIETFETSWVLETEEDLRDHFEQVVAHLRKMNVTTLARRVLASEFRGNVRISSPPETRLMVGHFQISDPYPALSVLIRQGQVWRVAEAKYAMTEKHAHAGAYSATK